MTSKVSILMSVYNAGPDLVWAIASLRAQTYTNWELIVIDDGSTDTSGKFLEQQAAHDHRIKVVHQDNLGLGRSLQRAAKLANSPLIARMDADDVSASTRIERLVHYFNTHPTHVLVGTWAWKFNPQYGITGAVATESDNHEKLVSHLQNGHNPFIHGSVMFRQSAYSQVAGYRFPDYSEEFDLWLQLSEQGQLGVLESIEYLYRENTLGMSYNNFYRTPHLTQLALQLAWERRHYGYESTDWLLECKRIRKQFSAPSTDQRKQIQAYSLGIMHLGAKYYKRATIQFLRSLRFNKLGVRAFARLFYSILGDQGIPDSRFGLVEKQLAQTSGRLNDAPHFVWTSSWLEKMGIPTKPYLNYTEK